MNNIEDTQKLAELLETKNFKCSVWEKAGHSRVYINGYNGKKFDRDATIYIQLDDFYGFDPNEPLSYGHAIKAYTNANQHPTWIKNRRRELLTGIMLKLRKEGLINKLVTADDVTKAL